MTAARRQSPKGHGDEDPNQLALELLWGERKPDEPAHSPITVARGATVAHLGKAEDRGPDQGDAGGALVVDEQRLPHPNPYGCAHCTNRATILLTLSTNERITVCRPHAGQYLRQAQPCADTRLDDEPVNRFTHVEQAIIRNAVADEAARYFGGLLGFGRDSAARYTSEAHLVKLIEKYGLSAVWAAVAAVIDDDPTVLERSPTERKRLRAARQARAESILEQALAALDTGDDAEANRLIDEAELIDPEYRPGRNSGLVLPPTWDEVRRTVVRVAARRATAAGLAGQDTPANAAVSGPRGGRGSHRRPAAEAGRQAGPVR
jgi:hypothetical protein